MTRHEIRQGVAAVGQALREPEAFALAWHRREAAYQAWVWLALLATATTGTLAYGLTLGIHAGPGTMLEKSVLFTVAAALAWLLPLPALYVLNSLTGSRLAASTTALAALVTVSWGGLALISSVPINWFFSVAFASLPDELLSARAAGWLVSAVHVTIMLGVGLAMADVFCRVIERLEPPRGRRPGWVLALVAAIGFQMAYVFGLVA